MTALVANAVAMTVQQSQPVADHPSTGYMVEAIVVLLLVVAFFTKPLRRH